MQVGRFLSAFLPSAAQASENTDKQMVIIHDGTVFQRQPVQTFTTYCTRVHTHTLDFLFCRVSAPCEHSHRQRNISSSKSPLSPFLSGKAQWDPGKEQGWCPAVRAPRTPLPGSHNEKKSAHRFSGRCFSSPCCGNAILFQRLCFG